MNKSFLKALMLSALFSGVIFSQDSSSIQINGGIIMPMSSSRGLATSIQYNYSLSPKINLYGYVGYSNWDSYKVMIHEDLSEIQTKQYFLVYPESDHILIPFYLGSKINLHTNKLFTSFANIEIGYSYLSYYRYEIQKIVNAETGEIIDYQSNISTKERVNENLFSLGIGAGLAHPINNNLDLIFSFKLNTNINSNYYGLFSTRGTYTMFLAGFNFKI